MDQRQSELLWRAEKYRVMFHSQNHYNAIRQAMKNQRPYEEVARLITEGLMQQPTAGSMRNTCQHMWGYFKKRATAEEKEQYTALLQAESFAELLVFLKQLAQKYEVNYLLESKVLHV